MNFTTSVHHLLAVTATTASKTKTSSSSDVFLIVVIGIFGVLYFTVMRPGQKRRMAAMRQNVAYNVGDEVVAGGMVGRVVRIGDGEVDIDAGDGVFTFVPQAVQSRAAFAARNNRGGMGSRMTQASSPAASRSNQADVHDSEYDDDDDDGTAAADDHEPEEGNWPNEAKGAWGLDKPEPEQS